MSNGKGSRPRPVNGDKFRANYDAIFRKPKLVETVKHSPTCWEYRYPDGTWIRFNPKQVIRVRVDG